MAGIGTATAGLTTSLNYYQSLSKDLTDSLEEIATSLITTPNQLDPLEKGKATHYSILAWRIPWTA